MKSSVILIGSSREHYFEQTLASIAPQLNGRKLFVLLDKPKKMGTRHQNQHMKIVERLGVDAEVICQPRHVGLGINMIQARDIALESHERAFIVEDDLVMSEDYLEYTEKMMDFSESKWDNVGVCQGWSDSWEEDPYNEYVIRDAGCHWWGYLQNKWSWELMRPFLYEYRDKFLVGVDYKSKHALSIVKWKRKIVDECTPPSYPRGACNNSEGLLRTIDSGAGQDSINLMTMYCLGLARMSPCRSKGRYIGMNGVNFTPKVWKRIGLDKQKSVLQKTEGEFTYIGEV